MKGEYWVILPTDYTQHSTSSDSCSNIYNYAYVHVCRHPLVVQAYIHIILYMYVLYAYEVVYTLV